MAYEIRPMTVGEILDTGFRLLRNHFGLLVGISAIAYVPMGIFEVLLAHFAGSASADGGARASALAVPVLIFVLLLGLAYAVALPLVATALTMALGDVYVGRPTSVGQALRQSWSILLPVVGTSLLATILIGLGFIALVIPGIWLMLSYWVSSQVMVLERTFGMAALRRSRDLMRGNKGRALLVGLVAFGLGSVVSGGATWALNAWPIVNAVASSIVGMVTYAFLYAVIVVFYFDILCRREAFDLEHLAQLVEQRGSVPAPAPAL